MLTGLARFSIRHRRGVIAAWLLLVVLGFGIGSSVFDRLETQGLSVPDNADSVEAERALVRQGEAEGDRLYGAYDGVSVDDPGFRASVTRVAGQLAAVPGVATVADPVSTDSPQLVARDRRAAAIFVELEPLLPPRVYDEATRAVVQLLRSVEAPTVLVSGDELMDEEFGDQAEKDLQKAELLSFPVLLVLLVVLFGGIVVAGLPLLVAFVGLAGTLLVLLVMSELTDVSVFAINVATMLGLGLAVDYGLLLVTRFREERALAEPALAVERTMATAGRTIVFSGLTVAVSMSGLLVYDDTFLRSMAAGGMAVVVVGLAASLTLLPALLMAASKRIRPAALAVAGTEEHGFFVRLSRVVQRRAVPIVVVVGAGLALLATPFLRAHFEEPDARYLPTSSEARQIADLADTRFAERTRTDPVTVVASVPPSSPDAAVFAERVRSLPGALSVAVSAAGGGTTVLRVTPDGTTQSKVATGLVRDIRDLDVAFPVAVTGDAAELVDTERAILDRLPWSLALLCGATLVLLFLLTGSVVVPIKALVMNLLSLGATFGALVWVFQDGHLAGLLGVDTAGALDIATPLLTFVTAFGLSMDYEVFLLSRIREAYLETGDNDRAVALGLQRTGRIVTSAAALIVVVFLGFMAGGFLSIKQAGLGLALAVILDATVVRMLLVPATMKLLGRWNWWAPGPLRRFHDRWGGWEHIRPAECHAGDHERGAAGRPGGHVGQGGGDAGAVGQGRGPR